MQHPHVEALPAGAKVALVIRDASIYEQDGELIPGCMLSPNQARFLAEGLVKPERRWRTALKSCTPQIFFRE